MKGAPRDYDGTEYPDAEPGEQFAASPDAFQRLWTPHRLAYVKDSHQPSEHDCPFCAAPAKSDEEALIVARGQHAFVLLNLFPYNAGHLLVCPYRHVAGYDEANSEEANEMALLTQTAMRVLRRTGGNDGFNIGMNQGEIAGAGIAAHLHQHIVPRWKHDSNFFPIIAGTKAVPRLLGEVRAELAAAWPAAEAD
ncbi:HIT family protein [Ruicaihuangia caeni]|uniref:HIT domain-containing protein n=1 Tax=Ruicaihuangia caeni TaxID=3042517 RepID=A0AAW6T6S5_9MICO|nr:HIT domain-containing protein [Klugiella sp. YN-L-19]MDI2098044.1 HIT domain-containing protein [Klugiella sp. YN-L-19]